jgi:D-alanine-D-alanine ligase
MIQIPDEKDGTKIHAINAGIPIFSEEEVTCVDEIWQDFLGKGSEVSGYYFLVEKEGNDILGYACYGPRALTSGTYDLYWIAVNPAIHRGGVGKKLLSACEESIRKLGGRLLFVETSGKPEYETTRKFYLGTGYTQDAIIKDFYSNGDDLVVFTKHL